MQEDIGFNFFKKYNSFIHIYNLKGKPAKVKRFFQLPFDYFVAQFYRRGGPIESGNFLATLVNS